MLQPLLLPLLLLIALLWHTLLFVWCCCSSGSSGSSSSCCFSLPGVSPKALLLLLQHELLPVLLLVEGSKVAQLVHLWLAARMQQRRLRQGLSSSLLACCLQRTRQVPSCREALGAAAGGSGCCLCVLQCCGH
jgi:hypothetical protein